MKAIFLAGGAALLSIFACSAPTAAADPLVLTDVRWIAEPGSGKKGQPRLRIQHKRSSSDQTFDRSRPYFAAAKAALGRTTPGPVSFTVAHEAGTLACTGTLSGAFEGAGECRFTSDPEFERQLGDRSLAPDQRSTLLAMLLVDATIGLADGLTREGVRPKDADDLIAAAALEVRPEYVRDLKSEALVLTDVEDAIACKALGVTGEYAQAMNRAAQGSAQ